jgi:hypothetical protein
MENRPCTGLESLFLQCNVRFAAGVLFVNDGIHQEIVEKAFRIALLESGLDRLRVLLLNEQNDRDNASNNVPSWIISLTPNVADSFSSDLQLSSLPGPRHIFCHHMINTDTLSQILNEIVASNDPLHESNNTSRENDLLCYMLMNDNAKDMHLFCCRGIVINVNHALCDGYIMRTCIETIVKRIDELLRTEENRNNDININTVTQGLGDILTEAKHMQKIRSTAVSLDCNDSTFLPSISNAPSIIKLNDIPGFIRDDSNDDPTIIRVSISSSVVSCCRQNLLPGTTVTGLMMASFIQAISEATTISYSKVEAHISKEFNAPTVSESSPRSSSPKGNFGRVSVSCLVDLRSDLTSGNFYTNAFGTVTVVGCGIQSTTVDEKDNKKRPSWNQSFLELAQSCTRDMQQRIQRGEALQQCIELCQGNFENDNNLPITMELSNQGIYQTTPWIQEIALGQRFDGYDGMSVLMASESNSGTLRLLINVGNMFRSTAIQDVINRVIEIWHQVANSDEDKD